VALTELSFRDGKRWVLDHIADRMEGIETFRLTYEEALAESNAKSSRDFINAAGRDFVGKHFKGFRG
jgi:hypothetical protein